MKKYFQLPQILVMCFLLVYLSLDAAHASEDLIDWRAVEVVNGDMLFAAAEADKDILRLKALAEKDNYYAQFILGTYFDIGRFVSQNHGKAFFWYQKAAKNGHFEAMVLLAQMYREGIGTVKEKSPKMEEEWLRCAATAGHKSAQHFLGLLYSDRAIITKKRILKSVIEKTIKTGKKPEYSLATAEAYSIKAHMWLNLAAAQAYPIADEAREIIASQLSRNALKKAQDLASNWVKRSGKCQAITQKHIFSTSDIAFKVQVAPELVCRAVIAAVMGRNPEIVKVTKSIGGIVYTSYIRSNDGTHWSNRCKVDGDRVVWATNTGRWRTHDLDSKITYSILLESKEIEISEQISSSSVSRTRYKLHRFGTQANK